MKSTRELFLKIFGLPKTLLFNFRYFPFKTAVKLPVLLSHRVWLEEMSGKVLLPPVVSRGMVRIGFGEVGIFDRRRSRSIWQVSGTVEFKGRADIGHGSRLSVSGSLVVGENFSITAESAVVVRKSVEIGRGVLFSWDVLVMDSDFHCIRSEDGAIINPDSPVRIGDGVWVGCRSLILKGAVIPDGVVVAAASVVSGPCGSARSVIGGNPARILKENVTWERHEART